MDYDLDTPKRPFTRRFFVWRGIAFAVLLPILIVGVVYNFYFAAPSNFPAGSVITIDRGSSLADIASNLEASQVVKSKTTFINSVILLGGERGLSAGDYFLEKPQNVIGIALRLRDGKHGLTPIRVTIPEGSSTFDIARIMKARVSTFNVTRFLALATDLEGYLFPDTYFLLPNARPHEVTEIMQQTYIERTKELKDEMAEFGKPERDVIIMASLLEGEARTYETRRMVAGVLWKRLALGMPLQVDATFRYINGKTSADLTLEDLRIDSPYNTYRYAGLPIGPISNPGLNSIRAAINPIESDYLYFLTDHDGVMHYSKTLDEHEAKRRMYLE